MKWGYGLARGALRGAARRRRLPRQPQRRRDPRSTRRSARSTSSRQRRSSSSSPFRRPASRRPSTAPSRPAPARSSASPPGSARRTTQAAPASRSVVDRVRAAGAVLLGPNCLGVFDAAAELDIGWSELPAGEIGLISQSGNLALELALIAAGSRARFLPLRLARQPGRPRSRRARSPPSPSTSRPGSSRSTSRTSATAERSRRACHAASLAGKPVVLLAAGRSDAASRAARSHTGALVSDFVAVQAACRAAGIEQVSTPTELIDTAQALLAASARGRAPHRRLRRRRRPRRRSPPISCRRPTSSSRPRATTCASELRGVLGPTRRGRQPGRPGGRG